MIFAQATAPKVAKRPLRGLVPETSGTTTFQVDAADSVRLLDRRRLELALTP
jgi:hypothetical protein